MTIDLDLDASVFVHPLALCESDHVGDGTRVWAFAQILAGATVGENCNICGHAFVEGSVTIGDDVTVKNGVFICDLVIIEDEVFIGPNATFTNDLRPRAFIKRGQDELVATTVRRGATIGAGVTVVCGTVIGTFAFVGAGAVVIEDVAPHALVVGNPARQVAWACRCGQPLDSSLACSRCHRIFGFDADGILAERAARGDVRRAPTSSF